MSWKNNDITANSELIYEYIYYIIKYNIFKFEETKKINIGR